jgi:hypothetical protein
VGFAERRVQSRRRCCLVACALVAAVSAAGSARAESMDPALERLVLDPNCHDQAGRWNDDPFTRASVKAATGREWCTPDNVAFKRLVNQYGFAFAPSAMHSARTTGFGGFHISIEAAYTNIDQGQSYWQNGTQGPVDVSSNKASFVNESPQSILQLYSAKIRKSFGFGLELTGSVGYMPKTSIISGGADVRLSLLEGFRSGIPGIFPDIAVGGGVRTITGTPELQLTVVGVDAQISKPLPIADSSILTPWVGYQYLWIFGDSGVVDLTPGTDAVGYCNYSGPNVPGNPAPNKNFYDGQPVCRGGSPLDFNNNVVFDKARLERHRLLLGVNYRYEMVMVGGQFITDLVKPADAQNSDTDKQALEGQSRQWTLVLEAGAMF